MAFSKFDPHRTPVKEEEGSTPAATRRIRILRWGNLITFLMTLGGFLLIVYWITKGR